MPPEELPGPTAESFFCVRSESEGAPSAVDVGATCQRERLQSTINYSPGSREEFFHRDVLKIFACFIKACLDEGGPLRSKIRDRFNHWSHHAYDRDAELLALLPARACNTLKGGRLLWAA